MDDIRTILERTRAGDRPVSAELLPLLYDELKNLAAGYMSQQAPGHTLQPTALVHEAWLSYGGRWKSETIPVVRTTGTHDLFLVFRDVPLTSIFKLDHWQFGKGTVPVHPKVGVYSR